MARINWRKILWFSILVETHMLWKAENIINSNEICNKDKIKTITFIESHASLFWHYLPLVFWAVFHLSLASKVNINITAIRLKYNMNPNAWKWLCKSAKFLHIYFCFRKLHRCWSLLNDTMSGSPRKSKSGKFFLIFRC